MHELTDDEPNARLLARVDPGRALAEHETYDLIAIGGGTAGLVGTAGMAVLGARTALVERNLLGGDCLVTGCVPSKALLHAARIAHEARNASEVGVHCGEVEVDFPAVMARLRSIRAEIGEDDSVATVSSRGVEVLGGHARFVGPQRVEIDGRVVRFKRALIATGGRPRFPDVLGLVQARPLTSETLFELTEKPDRMVVVGGGPIGCEMSQALVRLGVAVTLVQRGPRLLPADDPEASAIVTDALRADGVDVLLETQVERVAQEGEASVVHTTTGRALVADRILVATGRLPNVEGLDLEAAGVEYEARGICVDRRHRTTNRRIYAAGDVVGPQRFTHAAWAQAEYAVLNAFFPVRLDAHDRVMPYATYTDPEVAHVGLPFAELRPQSLDTLTVPMADNDRARLENDARGFARVHLDKGTDRIVAATIVGRGASELIVQLGSAITRRVGLSKLVSTIVPYPTRSEVIRDLAYAYTTERVARWRTWTERWFSLLR